MHSDGLNATCKAMEEFSLVFETSSRQRGKEVVTLVWDCEPEALRILLQSYSIKLSLLAGDPLPFLAYSFS